MKCAERIWTENDIDIVQQVDIESAIVYSASEQSAVRSDADRATASLNDLLKARCGKFILEEQAIIQRPEQWPGDDNRQEHGCDSKCDSGSQSDKWASGNNEHCRGEENSSQQKQY